MKLPPKDFQETAVEELHKRLDFAKQGVVSGIPQALVLSSPTGSGKTVTLAFFMEQIVKGDSTRAANPNATFLWVSDSPELNAQSLEKIFRASDAFTLSDLVPVDSTFDQEIFNPGKIYFINTSKLGKEKLLTAEGDKRTWTFWQTLANTSAKAGENFVTIIDEAHRGMRQSAQDRKKAETIVQKFVFGSDSEGLPPPGVPIILGMSATPQRFDQLLADTSRSKNVVKISANDVRDSGLLKDLILVHVPASNTPSDLTLLKSATERWQKFEKQWGSYCKDQKLDKVRPVLVVQVEDGVPKRKILSTTNLGKAIETIESVVGQLSDEDYAHCFQEDGTIEAGGRKIRKVEASRIQEEPWVRVVFFKMSLTLGWDCPRAEIMMSFRKAKDYTLIAQLVGRMVRTPLARRIEASEALNTVDLFLPHYDKKALEQILKELRNPDAETGTGAEAASGQEVVLYPRATGTEKSFALVETLPSYSIDRVPALPSVKRALRLASRLTLIDEIDPDALDQARDACTSVLLEARKRLAKSDPEFVDRVQKAGKIEIQTLGVEVAGVAVKTQKMTQVSLTRENIDNIFEQCGRVLGVGEGLHKEFWKRAYAPDAPDRAKLELNEILKDPKTLAQIRDVSDKAFNEIYRRNRTEISKLPASKIAHYNRLLGAGSKPEVIFRTMPPEIESRIDKQTLKGHLYADSSGDFSTRLNTWEALAIEEEMKGQGFVGWLRNFDRREWSIAVPYDDRGIKPFYPDFLILRREKGELVVDLLDPHNSKFDDTWAKAKGLAQYAVDHGNLFGRLEIAIVEKGEIFRLDVNDVDVRKKALAFQSNNDVDALFT